MSGDIGITPQAELWNGRERNDWFYCLFNLGL
jgi:hypothetical protein